MIFEEKKIAWKIGEKIGFVAMFCVFTTILYFLLKILNKIPVAWGYLHIALVSLLIVLLGILVKVSLK